LFSQAEIDSTQTSMKWKRSGNAIFLVNQSSFSNWTSGGQSSISGTLRLIIISIIMTTDGLGIQKQ